MGASVLRFSSPRTAWLLGVSFAVGQETTDEPVDFITGATTRSTSTVGTVEVRAEHRWWTGELSQALRPFVGLGLAGRYATANNARMNEAGAFGELGATYFFSPHVSLGGAGELAIVRDHYGFDSATGAGPTQDSWFVRGDVARITAAVYF
jgi:outer membrane protein W